MTVADWSFAPQRLCVAAIVLAFASALPLVRAGERDYSEPPITTADREHWAFQRVVRPEVPAAGHAVDVYVSAKLEALGLKLLSPASRRVLLRRAAFDLTGLPPSDATLREFETDESPDAWPRAIDRLLDSSAYGERWAQHWLDLVRYADTDGFEHDIVRPEAWRYRDWVIGALNRDLPYDQFLSQQLAGDQLAPDDPDTVIATGFLRCGPDMPDINSQDERRHTFLNDLTGTVGAALLGLQFGCAQCHDHKYDPISLADFYRLRGIFEESDLLRDAPLPGAPKTLARVVFGTISDSPPTQVLLRGDFRRPGPTLVPGFPRVLEAESISTETVGIASRRLQLAAWLANPRNPLTARVIVNRVWQHHFGCGLVGTPSDFGVLGDPPTHPELLDWLAAEFVSPTSDAWGEPRGWSLKRLHRILLTSAAWQQRSRPVESNPGADLAFHKSREIDPDNRWLSRFSRQRLDGESYRDSLLELTGRLNRQPGGPGVRPPLPPELVGSLLKNQWVVSPDVADHTRRSVYLFARRNLRYPLFEVLDRPDPTLSCPDRPRSTTAPQALTLLNSQFTEDAARALANLARAESAAVETQVTWLYERLFQRPATESELSNAVQFVNDQQSSGGTGQPDVIAGLADLCLALLNASEFLYID